VNLPDPRNADILIHVGGQLLPRAEAFLYLTALCKAAMPSGKDCAFTTGA